MRTISVKWLLTWAHALDCVALPGKLSYIAAIKFALGSCIWLVVRLIKGGGGFHPSSRANKRGQQLTTFYRTFSHFHLRPQIAGMRTGERGWVRRVSCIGDIPVVVWGLDFRRTSKVSPPSQPLSLCTRGQYCSLCGTFSAPTPWRGLLSSCLHCAGHWSGMNVQPPQAWHLQCRRMGLATVLIPPSPTPTP